MCAATNRGLIASATSGAGLRIRRAAIDNHFRQGAEVMLIGVPVETMLGEARVAITPETARKLKDQGHTVRVASGAGLGASYTDDAYRAVGAEVVDQAAALGCELVLKVRLPLESELAAFCQGAVLVGMLNPFEAAGLERLAKAGITAFALEAAPRTTRAQSMDVLSSQANIAGYKAVMIAADRYQRIFPMLMTAAGTVKAARVVILGVGVAGLQAIATAKRLGAVIEASDVRPSVKEQVESLGAKFIDVPYETAEEKEAAEGVGGYARPMPASWLQRQQIEVAKRVAAADIVITTALIPGRPAPVLVTETMVQSMKPGSVIVDLAAAQGGNCPLTEPGSTVLRHGVTIVGETNLPALVATDSSNFYARNVLDFLKLILPKEGGVTIDLEDDIVAGCLVARDGMVLRDQPAPVRPTAEASTTN
jgi:NAD(P) transhydrogenase subunit alpha